MKKTYTIEVDCAVCAQKCEDAIKKVEGVTDCQVNFMTQKMTLDAQDPDAILKQVVKAAKKVERDFELIS